MKERPRELSLILLTVGLLFWLMPNLYFFWVKVGGYIFLFVSGMELILLSILLVIAVRLLLGMIKYPAWRKPYHGLALAFVACVFTAVNLPWLRADENTWQSRVQLKACYEGTMNTSRLYLREDGSFEDFNFGWFGYVHYSHGTWRQKKDTLLLDFQTGIPRHLADSLQPTRYYLGNCQGLN